MKLKRINGYLDNESSFISFNIENGDNSKTIGDLVWFSEDGCEMEIYDLADEEIVNEALSHFDTNSKNAIKGYLRRNNVIFH